MVNYIKSRRLAVVIALLLTFSLLTLAGIEGILIKHKAKSIRIQKYGKLGQGLFDGRIILKVDSIYSDVTTPSASTECYFVDFSLKNISEKPVKALAVTVDFCTIDQKEPIFRNTLHLADSLERVYETVVNWTLRPREVKKLTALGHFYNNLGQRFLKIALQSPDSIVSGPFIVTDSSFDSSRILTQFPEISYISTIPKPVEQMKADTTKQVVAVDLDSLLKSMTFEKFIRSQKVINIYARTYDSTGYREKNAKYGVDKSGNWIEYNKYLETLSIYRNTRMNDSLLSQGIQQLKDKKLYFENNTEDIFTEDIFTVKLFPAKLDLMNINGETIRSWICLFDDYPIHPYVYRSSIKEPTDTVLRIDEREGRWRATIRKLSFTAHRGGYYYIDYEGWITHNYSNGRVGSILALGFSPFQGNSDLLNCSFTKDMRSNRFFLECRHKEKDSDTEPLGSWARPIDSRHFLKIDSEFNKLDFRFWVVQLLFNNDYRNEFGYSLFNTSQTIFWEVWHYNIVVDKAAKQSIPFDYRWRAELPSTITAYYSVSSFEEKGL